MQRGSKRGDSVVVDLRLRNQLFVVAFFALELFDGSRISFVAECAHVIHSSGTLHFLNSLLVCRDICEHLRDESWVRSGQTEFFEGFSFESVSLYFSGISTIALSSKMHLFVVRAGEVALYPGTIIKDNCAVHQMAACRVEAARLERATQFPKLFRVILGELLLSAQLKKSGYQCNIRFLSHKRNLLVKILAFLPYFAVKNNGNRFIIAHFS